MSPSDVETRGARPAVLGLFDSISVIVGIVVGASIYKVSPIVVANVESPLQALGLWMLGAVLSLLGAFCYAELATTYPRSGGDYVYLTRAYGRLTGFLFGWAHLGGILTGSIGAMAFVFSEYATPLFLGNDAPQDQRTSMEIGLAISAIVSLSVMNVLGVVLGKWVQNLLTVAKVVGLGAIIVSGLGWGEAAPLADPPPAPFTGDPAIALILILYAYGGWSDAAFVAAEVKDTRRNLPRALILGIGCIAVVYLLVNVAYLKAMGFEGLRASAAPAADALRPLFGQRGERAMRLLVMVSSLGALNGLIFTGSRVHASLGADHRLFAWLGRWDPRLRTPVASLLTQMSVTISLVSLVGTPQGRSLIDKVLTACRLNPIPWNLHDGFGTLVVATAPVFWTFFLLTGFAVVLLRHKDSPMIRPFRVPLYPLTPILFCAVCGFMAYRALLFAGNLALIGLIPLALGVPAYFVSGGTAPEEGAKTQR